MKEVGYIVAISIMIFSSSLSYAYSSLGDLVTTAWPLNNPLERGDFPIIVGNVKDQKGNPIEGAQVKITFATETISSITNNVGSFYIELKTPAQPGDYKVNIITTKEGYGMNIINTSYFVNGISQPIPNVDLTIITQVPTLVQDGFTKNPLSQIILKHMEEVQRQQQEEEKKRQEIENRKNLIDKQRQIAQNTLEEDLKNFEKQFDFFTPRLAFGRFVQGVDDTVKFIFWEQFNFTEKKHTEAYAAKVDAIKNGENTVEATKIFQRKATVTKSEIIDYNSELNVKYGLADKNTQRFFDSEGKLRWNKDSIENKTIFWHQNSEN
jgi:hypothetical protein